MPPPACYWRWLCLLVLTSVHFDRQADLQAAHLDLKTDLTARQPEALDWIALQDSVFAAELADLLALGLAAEAQTETAPTLARHLLLIG